MKAEIWRNEMMRKLLSGFSGMILLLATGAAAQTTVTTSGGTTNTVQVYTGSATLGNSPISVSGSNVGIGTTFPHCSVEYRSSR